MSLLKVEAQVKFESDSHLNVAVARSDARPLICGRGFDPHIRQPWK